MNRHPIFNQNALVSIIVTIMEKFLCSHRGSPLTVEVPYVRFYRRLQTYFYRALFSLLSESDPVKKIFMPVISVLRMQDIALEEWR